MGKRNRKNKIIGIVFHLKNSMKCENIEGSDEELPSYYVKMHWF